ncbi:MAG: hypothetical protein M3238_04300 [Actinomycetota bacterium]|nr:hypothetical protein [Actinomycetota bacterium]
MGFMDKAKEAAEQAKQAAKQTVDQARGPSAPAPTHESPAPGGVQTPAGAPPGVAPAPSVPADAGAVATAPVVTPAPAGTGMDDFKASMKKVARRSKDTFATLVEKIDPGVLADLIIKATAAQEKANIALRERSSPYRIAEINITATIPPQVGFSVQRMGDMDELDNPSSLELLEEGVVDAEAATESLDGANPIEDIGTD